MIGSRYFRRRPGGEHGFILVWTSVMLLLLLGIASLVIDLGIAWNRSSKAQQAADAAATAGVIHLPKDVAGAITAAKQTAAENGFTLTCDPPYDSAVTCPDIELLPPGAQPTHIQVTVKSSVSTFLATASFGNFGSIAISKSSEAAYYAQGKMGSPDNVFGNEPHDPSTSAWRVTSTLPGMWGNVNGPQTRAQDGDPSHHWTYKIDVSETGNLDLQIFDPMWSRQKETTVGATACGSYNAKSEPFNLFAYANKAGADAYGNTTASSIATSWGWIPQPDSTPGTYTYQELSLTTLGGQPQPHGIAWPATPGHWYNLQPQSDTSIWVPWSLGWQQPSRTGHWGPAGAPTPDVYGWISFLNWGIVSYGHSGTWYPDMGTWIPDVWGPTGYTTIGTDWPPDPYYGGPTKAGASYPYCSSDETGTGNVPWLFSCGPLGCTGPGPVGDGMGYDPRNPVRVAPPESFAKKGTALRPAAWRAAPPNPDLYAGAATATCDGTQMCTYPRTFFTLYRYDLTQPDQIGQEVCRSKTWDLDPGNGVSSDAAEAAKWYSYVLAMNSHVVDAPDPGANDGQHHDIVHNGYSGNADPVNPISLDNVSPMSAAVSSLVTKTGSTWAQAVSQLQTLGAGVAQKYQNGYRVWANYVGSGPNGTGTPECGPGGSGNLNGWTGQVKAGESYVLSVSADCSHVDAAPNGGPCRSGIGSGSNHYSLRAFVERSGHTPGVSKDPGVSIAGDGNESIYNVTTGTSKLYLSKVLPSGTQRKLHVHLYDIGDAETPGTLSIRDDNGLPALPTGTPAGTPGYSSWLTEDNCQHYQAVSMLDTSPAGPVSTGCSVTVTTATNNGTWLDFVITVPSNYQCSGLGVDSCWVKAYIDWQDPNKTVHDVTSWFAAIEGDPVRLVNPGSS